MKHAVILLTLSLLMLTACGNNGEYIEIVDALDVNNTTNTSMNIKTKWEEVKGRQIRLSGKVVDVKGGRSSAEAYIAIKGKPLYRNYNVIVKTYDLAGAGKLKRGDTVEFDGQLYSYKQRSGAPLILVLNNGNFAK
ncbi:hypothetical protein BVY04_02495 [bacterium M21]|nr:hypothetical protein BVY04_02495 [bacterium M21]